MYGKVKFPLCNGKPERAPALMGHTFILCWRCSMVILGVIFSISIVEKLNITIPSWGMVCGGVLLFPMLVDGVLQYFINIQSTNFRRAVTGFLFGVGITSIAAYWCP